MVDDSDQDLLTGLMSESAFVNKLSDVMASTAYAPFAVVAVGLPIADDGVLIDAARRLRDVTRSKDFVARIGTSEFAVCCRWATEPEGFAVARRIAEMLAQPFEIGSEWSVLNVRVGVVMREEIDAAEQAMVVIREARAAMGQISGP